MTPHTHTQRERERAEVSSVLIVDDYLKWVVEMHDTRSENISCKEHFVALLEEAHFRAHIFHNACSIPAYYQRGALFHSFDSA